MLTPKKTRGLRISDLVGLVVGYSLAALLIRTFGRASNPSAVGPMVALGLAYAWLGMAMSGPVLLLLDRRGGPVDAKPRDRRPRKPGRLISAKEPAEPPIGQRAYVPKPPEPSRYTRAELAWMICGGYWIAMAMFAVTALSVDPPRAAIGLMPLVVVVGLCVVLPGRPKSAEAAWTHVAGVILMLTWPFAWGALYLLSKGV